MELKLLKKINILSNNFTIKYEKGHLGGSVDFDENLMTIGIQNFEKNQDAVFQLLCHEILEAIQIITNTRYMAFGTTGDYLFISSHKEFQTNMEIFSSIISKFIK